MYTTLTPSSLIIHNKQRLSNNGLIKIGKAMTFRSKTIKKTTKMTTEHIFYQPTKVAILMGSPNDYEKMKSAKDVLIDMGLIPEMMVMSAHRQPYEVAKLASNARNDGYAAIICGAGMAAHLAGVVASHTTLPVVGVPLSSSSVSGVDSLYSTVQMPKGIPVATVAIDNSTNAAILVAQMLSITNKTLSDKLYLMRQTTRETLNSTKLI
jgi:5-(carboxyamino)imidazole ribonucleotide mutase